jgi:hypothetical protein
MKKLSAIGLFILVFSLMSGTSFPQAEYTLDGQNPFELSLETTPPYDCQYVTIALDPNEVINTPLILAGFWLTYDDMHVSVRNVAVYDGELTPALWDPAFTSKLPPGETGTYFLVVANFTTVPLDDLRIADVEFCLEGTGQSQITVSTIPGFDTVVSETTVWDPLITNGIINPTQLAPACICDVKGATFIQSNPFGDVTEQYAATSFGSLCGPPAYVWSDDCDQGDIDQTGLLTVPAFTDPLLNETCTITVVDYANTDINTGDPVECFIDIVIEEGW